MAWRLGPAVFIAAVAALAGGCALVEPAASRKPLLAQSKPAPDSVTLEVFLATVSGGKATVDALWNEVDEQNFSADLRRELALNGFRIGLVGSHIPIPLARLLMLTDKPVPKDGMIDVTAEQPKVSLRVLQLRAGHPAEIQPLEHVYDQLPLLMREDGQLRGRTYYKAEGRLALRAYPEPDGKIRVELTPELEHGEQHQRWVGNDGIMRLDAARPKRVFEQLALTARLAPGEFLIMTNLNERSGTAGHYFFSQGAAADQPEQKILAIRAAQAVADSRFKVDEPKQLDLDIE